MLAKKVAVRLLTTKEAAKKLDLHPSRVRALLIEALDGCKLDEAIRECEHGYPARLQGYKQGRDWLVEIASVDFYNTIRTGAGRPRYL